MDEVAVYEVGDIVTIVAEPLKRCVFGWPAEMTEFCGREAKIVNRYRDFRGPDGFAYTINIDGRRWKWPSNAFVPMPKPLPIEDFDLSVDDLLSMIGGA